MSKIDEIKAERLDVEREIDVLLEHTEVAQEWLAGGGADALSSSISTDTMEALEAVVSACDIDLKTLQYRLKKLEVKISNMKFRSA